ncbi:MAG: FecR domain-containing protein [bacterium]
MKLFFASFSAVAFCALLLCGNVFADNDKDVALMIKTKGKVEIRQSGRRNWVLARRGNRLDSGQVVRTGASSLAAVVFTDDKTLMKIRANSSVTIKGKREKNSIIKTLTLNAGELWAKVSRQRSAAMRIETPSGVATVKGTELNCLYLNDTFVVFCKKGLIELINQLGSLLLGANEMGRIVRGSAPQRFTGNPNDVFEMGEDELGSKIEIFFEDKDHNKKKLILQF